MLPGPVRRKLGLQPGDALEVTTDEDRIVLTPGKRRPARSRIIKDPITGWPVLSAGQGTPKLTNKQVQEILADFP